MGVDAAGNDGEDDDTDDDDDDEEGDDDGLPCRLLLSVQAHST